MGRIGWGANSKRGSGSHCYMQGGGAEQAIIFMYVGVGGLVGVVYQLCAKTSPAQSLSFAQSHTVVVIK